MSFCKTEVNKKSHDGIESIYQNKVDTSLNSDSKVKEGVCCFLKSRLPTAEGTINGGRLKFFVTQDVNVVSLNVAWFLMLS